MIHEAPIIVSKGFMHPSSETEHDGILVTSTICLRLNRLERDLAWIGKQEGKLSISSLMSTSYEPQTQCCRPCRSLVATP